MVKWFVFYIYVCVCATTYKKATTTAMATATGTGPVCWHDTNDHSDLILLANKDAAVVAPRCPMRCKLAQIVAHKLFCMCRTWMKVCEWCVSVCECVENKNIAELKFHCCTPHSWVWRGSRGYSAVERLHNLRELPNLKQSCFIRVWLCWTAWEVRVLCKLQIS